MENDGSQKLLSMPLRELSISRPLLKDLMGAGAHNLAEAFELDDRTIVEKLSDQSDDELMGYFDLFNENPDALAKKLMQKKQARPATSSNQSSKISPREPNSNRKEPNDSNSRSTRNVAQRAPQRLRSTALPTAFYLLPQQPFSNNLIAFEQEAAKEFKRLDDHASEAIVAEVFPAFELQMDDYRESWQEFFAYYGERYAARRAFDIIEATLPCSFVIVVADAARRLHEGRTVLEHIYTEFSIDSQYAQGRLKSLFMNVIQQHGMQTYSSDEAFTYYQHTILLHAGLSMEAWRSLWEDTLLPLARLDDVRQAYDGMGILRRALESGGSYQVSNKGVRHMLAKAPPASIASLLESSLNAARQYERFAKESTDTALISNEGLSGEAMQALLQVVEHKQGLAARKTLGKTLQRGGGGASTRAFYWMNDPSLFLDLRRSEKPVCVKIEGQRLSSDFADRLFEYYVNGKLIGVKPAKQSIHGCMLESYSVWVEPAEQYAVEIKIMQKVARNKRRSIASRITYFVDEREGVFEFVGAPGDDVLRYSKKSYRHGKAVRKAYLVYPGYFIERGNATTPVPTVNLDGDFSTVAFEAKPGSTATVVAPDGRKVAWLQEQFSTSIHRPWVMGSLSGKDLFGLSHLLSEGDYNNYLPYIEIIAPESQDALADLDITCMCDGKPCYPYARTTGVHGLEDNDDFEVEGSRVFINLALTITPSLIEDGRLLIKHRSTGETILDYRFAVLPINGLRLDTIGWGNGTYMARYSFACCGPTIARDSLAQCSTPKNEGERIEFRAPLKDESGTVELVFKDGGVEKSLMPRFMLAGMSIEPPACWDNASRSISFDDVVQEDGKMRISVLGNRTWEAVSRGFLLLCGGVPIACVPDISNTQHNETDVFAPLLEQTISYTKLGEEEPANALSLMVFYGWPENNGESPRACEIVLGQLRQSFDNKLQRKTRPDGSAYLDFGIRPRCELYYRFSNTDKGMILDEDNPLIELPKKRRTAMTQKPTRLQLAACGPFDFEPNWKLVQIIDVEEGD